MRTLLRIDGKEISFETSQPIDVSIPLRFNGPQPNAYGVEHAVSEPVKADSLVGDTRLGGSVNFERYTFIPHCSGTHTECVGHITNERISMRDCLKDVLIPAMLVSVEPQNENGDLVITRGSIETATANRTPDLRSLIIRTIPNDETKLVREYGEGNIPPYFSTDAMNCIVELGVKHLLVDLPSIDRIYDGGKLLNHRRFWNVEPGSFEVNVDTRINSTITEMIYVPNETPDGDYLLNLQIAPFESDCAPSRPLIFRSY